MANGTTSVPGLSFPREAFAKLTPEAFLQAHLKRSSPIRPNGRTVDEFRKPIINTGSLTHSNGSAVVRMGDTAVVCAVRGEILVSSDISKPPIETTSESEMIQDLGLLVPNVELSTGCSPAHLPGNPPGSLAQSLSYRIYSLLHNANMVQLSDLQILHKELQQDDELSDEEPRIVTKAYWTLYIDILCIALDGNAFDAAWLALVAALNDTTLPNAWWDADRETILCSPLASDKHKLRILELPSASTFVVFTTASPLKQREDAQSWLLADPDTFEEDSCYETVTIVLVAAEGHDGDAAILRIEKSGGVFVDSVLMKRCHRLSQAHRRILENALKECR